MGLRLILLGLALWVVYSVVRRQLTRRSGPTPGSTSKRPPVDMVRCAHCGVHLPAPEALCRDGKHYCSRAHLEAGQRRHPDGK